MRNKVLGLVVTVLLVLLINPIISAQMQMHTYPREKTYVIAYHAGERIVEPDYWNPLVPVMGAKSYFGFEGAVMEYFFYIDFETGELIPWLAEKYEYSPDFSRLRVYLRKGVEWNDGVPFTADDVVFTYNRIYLNGTLTGKGYSPTIDATIKSVEKVDDYTVDFILEEPNPRFHLAIDVFPTVTAWHSAKILPKHVFNVADPSTVKNYPPVGTGAYKVIEVGSTYTVLERRDDWWATKVFGIRPAPKYIMCRSWGSEDETAFRFTANEIDYCMFGTLTFGSTQRAMTQNPEIITWWRTSPYLYVDPCPRVLMFNVLRYPWSIPEVRKAVSYMIDRDLLAKTAYEGTTVPAWYPFPPYGALSPYLEAIKDLRTKYEPDVYDVNKANAILTSIGFKKGADGVWVSPNGTRLSLEIVTWAEHAELMRATTVLVDQLRTIGIDATIKPLSTSSYFQEIMLGHYEAAYSWLCPGDTDPIANLRLFHSKYFRPEGEMCPTFEASHRYRNPEMDGLINEMEKTSPELQRDKYIGLVKEAMDLWYKDLPVVLLVQTPAVLPFNTHYWTGFPSGENPWLQPLVWMSHMVIGITGYKSPKTGEWVGGIRPKTVSYVTVYFKEDVPKFRGIDLTWYGPFKKGDAGRVPDDDTEFLIARGYASLTPPSTLPTEVTDAIKSTSNTLSSLSSAVSTLQGTLTALMAVQVITLILVIVVIAFMLRKK
jgi:peptide/nickel transport system substrate-binding protein